MRLRLLVGLLILMGIIAAFLAFERYKILNPKKPEPAQQLGLSRPLPDYQYLRASEEQSAWPSVSKQTNKRINFSFNYPKQFYARQSVRGEEGSAGLVVYFFADQEDYAKYIACIEKSKRDMNAGNYQTQDWEGGCNLENLLMKISMGEGHEVQEYGWDNQPIPKYSNEMNPWGATTDEHQTWYIQERDKWFGGFGSYVYAEVSGITDLSNSVVNITFDWPTQEAEAKTEEVAGMDLETLVKEVVSSVKIDVSYY